MRLKQEGTATRAILKSIQGSWRYMLLSAQIIFPISIISLGTWFVELNISAFTTSN